ncbi:hypothetical protein EH220_05130 [bacterium]|nr:MAG: hypothetical protein EH220_05130 [bacterium]
MVRTKVPYDGDVFCLEPESENSGASVWVERPLNTELHVGEAPIRRFLSALSWVKGWGIEVLSVMGCGSDLMRVGKHRNLIKSPDFRVDYLPNPNDERARLALALYREGMTVNSIPYKFLSFYKIINILLANGDQQKKWINNQVPLLHIKDQRLSKSLASITDSDIGNHIYVSGRCAIAHAYSTPVVNPDKPDDTRRLENELFLIQVLAERLIENEFKVKSYSTFHKEHLYELEGFASRMAPDIVDELRKGNEPTERPCIPLEMVSIKLRDQIQQSVFTNMKILKQTVNKGKIRLLCSTQDSLSDAFIELDFVNWRLIFNPDTYARVVDDQSPNAASYEAERLEFVSGHLLNGEVEVYDESNNLLGRSDCYIPYDVDVKGSCDLIEQKVDYWYSLCESRRKASVNDHEEQNKPNECGTTGDDLETKTG